MEALRKSKPETFNATQSRNEEKRMHVEVQSRTDEFKQVFAYGAPPHSVFHNRIENMQRATVLVGLVVLFSTLAFSQKEVTASANIPFNFWAQGEEFTAGDYVFDTGYPGSVTIRRKGTTQSIAVAVITYGDPVKQEDAKLLFVGRDGKYYLAEVWCIQDRRVVTAEFDHRGQLREEQRQVSLMYP